jgi:hypothetical protein
MVSNWYKSSILKLENIRVRQQFPSKTYKVHVDVISKLGENFSTFYTLNSIWEKINDFQVTNNLDTDFSFIKSTKFNKSCLSYFVELVVQISSKELKVLPTFNTSHV